MKKSANNISRRDVLKAGALGVGGLAFLSASPAKGFAGAVAELLGGRRKTGKAKSVIQIWMWGGPCHIDTFDPKPGAGYDYCGPLNKTIKTNADGVVINASLPMLAKHADKYSIIRGMTHGINAHETASYATQTGHLPGRLVFPCVGAVVSKFKGYDAGYKGVVPPYIVLTRPQGRFSEAGILGLRYKPFATGGDPKQNPFAVEGIVAKGISDDRQKARKNLLGKLDLLGAAVPGDPAFADFDKAGDKAYGMMFGDARKVFDLSGEKQSVRERYGMNTFGQSCLAARRLVENGVPYVTINYKGWDTHKQHFQTMDRKLPELDRGMSALLADLADRGLLDSTIVWWSGEFGRSPKVQWAPPWNGGRGHHGQAFSAVVAGGGFKGGRVVGATDKYGNEVAERPVHPREFLATMYTLLGIDPDGPLPNSRGLDLTVLPPDKKGTGLVSELI